MRLHIRHIICLASAVIRPLSLVGLHPEKVSNLAKMEWENGSLGAIFVPDVVTPGQYYEMRRDDSAIAPVKRLMNAVLEDALRCFQNNADAKGGPRKRLFAEAEQWLCDNSEDGPFSFETVCETLGIEPQFLRAGLKEWRNQQLAGVATHRLARRSPVVRSGKISAPVRRSSRQRITRAS
jgi:hypothetical protein